jgi:hypothetical protein
LRIDANARIEIRRAAFNQHGDYVSRAFLPLATRQTTTKSNQQS